MVDLDEVQLIEEIKKGRRDFFEKLVDRYLPMVLAFLRSIGVPSSLVEDVCQEAFLRAFLHIDSYVPQGSFLAWVMKIARNVYVDEVRKRSKEGKEVAENREQISSPSFETLVIGQTRFDEILAALPLESRLLLEMRVIQKVSFSEIAKSLDESEVTVRVRFHRIMAQLREKVGTGEQG